MTAELPRAMVLAAGLGTRLAPLTSELPKPLCPIGDRAQIDHVLARLAAAGVTSAVVNTHALADRWTEAWRRSQPLEVVLVHEPEILGTGGGVRNAAGELGPGEVLVWNADVLVDLDVAALVAVHRASGALATLAVAPAAGGGSVGLAEDGRVARLRAARRGAEVERADYAGVAVLSQHLRDALPMPGCLVGDALVPAIDRGDPVATFRHDGAFRDVGSIEAYLEANLDWLAARGQGTWAHPSAAIDPSVALVRSVVGEGATVTGSGALDQCVVWPGALAKAPLTRAVVTPRGVVATPRRAIGR